MAYTSECMNETIVISWYDLTLDAILLILPPATAALAILFWEYLFMSSDWHTVHTCPTYALLCSSILQAELLNMMRCHHTAWWLIELQRGLRQARQLMEKEQAQADDFAKTVRPGMTVRSCQNSVELLRSIQEINQHLPSADLSQKMQHIEVNFLL